MYTSIVFLSSDVKNIPYHHRQSLLFESCKIFRFSPCCRIPYISWMLIYYSQNVVHEKLWFWWFWHCNWIQKKLQLNPKIADNQENSWHLALCFHMNFAFDKILVSQGFTCFSCMHCVWFVSVCTKQWWGYTGMP